MRLCCKTVNILLEYSIYTFPVLDWIDIYVYVYKIISLKKKRQFCHILNKSHLHSLTFVFWKFLGDERCSAVNINNVKGISPVIQRCYRSVWKDAVLKHCKMSYFSKVTYNLNLFLSKGGNIYFFFFLAEFFFVAYDSFFSKVLANI